MNLIFKYSVKACNTYLTHSYLRVYHKVYVSIEVKKDSTDIFLREVNIGTLVAMQLIVKLESPLTFAWPCS